MPEIVFDCCCLSNFALSVLAGSFTRFGGVKSELAWEPWGTPSTCRRFQGIPCLFYGKSLRGREGGREKMDITTQGQGYDILTDNENNLKSGPVSF